MNDIINNIDKNIDKLSTQTLTKYNLEKEQRKVTILSKPNITSEKLTKEDIRNIKNKKLGNELIKFRKKLYQKVNNENLSLLNNNLISLKVKIRYLAPEIVTLKVAAGKYNIVKNKITILNQLKNLAINHELFHMATTFYDKKLKIGFCGFQQILFYKKESFGKGLNEGYTQLISRRYFNETNECVIDGYEVCMHFAEKLEEIVDKDRMETFYFNADLMGLYKYLTKFDEGSNVATFIAILDNIVKKRFILDIKNDIEYELLICYLSKWFIKKKEEELSKNIIDKIEFDKQINYYLNSLGAQKLYLKNCKKLKEYCLK